VLGQQRDEMTNGFLVGAAADAQLKLATNLALDTCGLGHQVLLSSKRPLGLDQNSLAFAS
jgi:hypothetical protein